ncbi:MAG: 5-proFAR isomerase [Lachnoclostridium sp.]|jgi:phosphoribosylformimino-5-aminoimidazole carboxamide ribotide isomerase
MKFRPCIDIHNGKVKQIVGGSLSDENTNTIENYVSEQDADAFAALYKKDNLKGGHIIMLNSRESGYYGANCNQAKKALKAYPGGLQIGGGITAENAVSFLDAGASHVIVTSYVFRNGMIFWDNLKKLVDTVGKDRLVLDLSCRKKDGRYYIVTDRWQKFTDVEVNLETLNALSSYCNEFLIHAVDVEGKASGIEKDLAVLLGKWGKIPITYAGGISSFEDIHFLKKLGQERLDFTIGSALDLFGGTLKYKEVVKRFG